MNISRLTAALVTLSATGLMAQQVTGTLTGVVKDQKGGAIAGARIAISSNQIAISRVTLSDASGAFRVPLLPPGTYVLVVEKEGFVTGRASTQVTSGNTERTELRLANLTSAQAVVEVIATSSQVDKTQTVTQSSFTIEELQALPFGNNAFGALAVAPGTTGTQTYAAIRGGMLGQAQYNVNGISVRDNVTMQGRQNEVVLDDLVQDVNVVQSPLNARYGDSSSGFVNVVTKSGGNDWTGSLRVKLAKESWSARRPGVTDRLGNYYTGEPQGNDALNRTFEATIAGPIVKDMLTFTYGTRVSPTTANTFVNPDISAAQGNQLVFNGTLLNPAPYQSGQTIAGASRETYNEFKLTWAINQDHTLDLGYTEDLSSNFTDFNVSSPDSSVDHLQTAFNKFSVLNYRGILTPNSFIEAKYGMKKTRIKFESGPLDPINMWIGTAGDADLYDVVANNGNLQTVNGSGADSQAEQRDNETISLNYNLILDGFGGQHVLDMGVERHRTIWGTVQNSGGPNGLVFFNFGRDEASGDFVVANYNSPETAGLPVTLFGASFPTRTAVIQYAGLEQSKVNKPTDALYINDAFTLNNHLSIMAGLRYERFKLEDAIGTRYSSSAISPRLEVKFDLGGDQKRIFNFSYGQFRGNVGERITRSMTAVRRGAMITRLWNGSPSGLAELRPLADIMNLSNYGQTFNIDDASQTFAIDKGFKPDVNNEITLGYRRGFSKGGFFRATLISREWKDLPNAIADPAIVAVNDPTGLSAFTVNGYKKTLVNDSQAKRSYKGLELEWSYPIIENKLNFTGNYTFSKLTANNTYGDSTGFAATQALALKGTFYKEMDAAGVSRDLWMPEGELATSNNHVANMWLSYHATNGKVYSSLSLAGRYLSGGRVSLTNNLSTSFLGAAPIPSTYALFYNGRGRYTNDDALNFDLQYNVNFPINKKLNGFVALSVNQLFNTIRFNSPGRPSGTTAATLAQINAGTNDYRATNAPRWGLPLSSSGTVSANSYAAWSGGRSMNLDFGIRF